jgi:GT2 family glycosyltransferase
VSAGVSEQRSSADAHCAVIVLTYNGLETLKQCLPSLFGFGKLVILDNGSTDETAEYVLKTWPSVTLVRLPENRGLGAALNTAVRSVRATNVVLMNNDVIAVGDGIKRLVETLDSDPSIGVVAPILLNADGSVQECGNDMHVSGLAIPARGAAGPLFETFFQSGCVTAVRREQFLRLGGYGEIFEWYYEDVDLSWRFFNEGYRAVVRRDAACIHLQGATLGSSATGKKEKHDSRHSWRMRMSNSNVILLLARNAPWFQVALQLPFVAMRQVVEMLAALSAADWPLAVAYPKAWYRAATLLPAALREKGAVASRRSTLRFVRLDLMRTLKRLSETTFSGHAGSTR